MALPYVRAYLKDGFGVEAWIMFVLLKLAWNRDPNSSPNPEAKAKTCFKDQGTRIVLPITYLLLALILHPGMSESEC